MAFQMEGKMSSCNIAYLYVQVWALAESCFLFSSCSEITAKYFPMNFTGDIAPILPSHTYRIL